jgi:hypothetical protein
LKEKLISKVNEYAAPVGARQFKRYQKEMVDV